MQTRSLTLLSFVAFISGVRITVIINSAIIIGQNCNAYIIKPQYSMHPIKSLN